MKNLELIGKKIRIIEMKNEPQYTNKEGIVDLASDTSTKFRDVWSAKRLGVVGALIIGTGFIMSFIPKLYTLASGGINPGGKAIYDEAAKREGK